MTPDQTRAKAILTSDLGKEMPAMAQHLTFETDLTAEAAIGLLGAVKKDVATELATRTASTGAWDSTIKAANGLAIVHDNSGAGLGTPENSGGKMSADVVTESWKKAVAAANASIGIRD
jgi:hypothetical protein